MESKEGQKAQEVSKEPTFIEALRSKIRAMVHRDVELGMRAARESQEAKLKVIDRLSREGSTDNVVSDLEDISKLKKQPPEK